MEGTDVADGQALKRLREVRSSLGDKASKLLFRGQSNFQWQLTTTLERDGCEGASIEYYYVIAQT
jgi:hypothetical protein